jgi:hypothetical protein
MALAFGLGFVIALVMQRLAPGARRRRVSVLVLLPPVLLLGVFLMFTRGAPQADEWIWMGVGLAFFWPWYLAFVGGGLVEKTVRTARGRSEG